MPFPERTREVTGGVYTVVVPVDEAEIAATERKKSSFFVNLTT